MGRSIGIKTYHRYLDIVKLVRECPETYNQQAIAKHLGVSPTTVGKFLRGYPWFVSFSRDPVGRWSYTGEDVDIPNEIRFAEVKKPESTQPYKSDPAILTAIFSTGDPFLNLRTSARQHLQKMQRKQYDETKLLSGADINRAAEMLRKFAQEVDYQARQVTNKPQFGRDEWWMDYLD